jgi:hypothetical protein
MAREDMVDGKATLLTSHKSQLNIAIAWLLACYRLFCLMGMNKIEHITGETKKKKEMG